MLHWATVCVENQWQKKMLQRTAFFFFSALSCWEPGHWECPKVCSCCAQEKKTASCNDTEVNKFYQKKKKKGNDMISADNCVTDIIRLQDMVTATGSAASDWKLCIIPKSNSEISFEDSFSWNRDALGENAASNIVRVERKSQESCLHGVAEMCSSARKN